MLGSGGHQNLEQVNGHASDEAGRADRERSRVEISKLAALTATPKLLVVFGNVQEWQGSMILDTR